MTTIPKTIPLGRIVDLRSHPDAQLIAVKPGTDVWSDYTVKRYASRLALETFLRNAGGWHALVKNKVHPSMLVHPAFQTT